MSTPPEEAAAAAPKEEETPHETETTTEEAAAPPSSAEPTRQELLHEALYGNGVDDEPLFVMMSQPTTALIVLSNQMLFKPDEDIIHLIVTAKEDLATCLEEHVSLEMPVADGSLETIHLVVRAADVDRLFDETAFAKWTHLMQPGAELTVHVVSDGSQVADSDVEFIAMALLTAELRLTSPIGGVDGPDGSKLLTGRKLGGTIEEEDEEDGSSSDGDNDTQNNQEQADNTQTEASS